MIQGMTDSTIQSSGTAISGPLLRTSISLAQCCEEWVNILDLVRRPPPKRDWRSDTGYGLMDIYVEAAGLPTGYRPHINTLHAMFIGMADHWYKTSEAGFRSVPAIFVHNEPDRANLERVLGGWKHVLVAPHPFHYIVRHHETAAAKLKPEGSVFFLPHTLGQPQPRIPLGLTIKRLQALPADYAPIDVCLHSNDVSESMIATFQSHGFNVVTAGNRHDPAFLHRFFWLSRRRHYAIMVDHGTQLWLASMAGCEILILRDIPDMIWAPANNSFDWMVAPREHYWALLDELNSSEIDQERLRSLIWGLTSGDRWLDAVALRDLFKCAEQWYASWLGADRRLRFPSRYWSLIEPEVRRYRSLRVAVINRLSGRRGRWQPMSIDLQAKLIAYERACRLYGNTIANPIESDLQVQLVNGVDTRE